MPELKDSTAVILMGTYNGGRFIREQLDSIAAQTHTDWRLLVRDDGSTDQTVTLLERAAADDRRIEILRDTKGNLGPPQNFSELCTAAETRGYPYIFFADQDDIWHPDKVAQSLAALRSEEDRSPNTTPLLLHTDLTVVDEDRNVVDTSLMHYSGFHHVAADPLRTLLVQNFVTGCSVACNRALLRLAAPIPSVAIMHDYWFALCAAAYGQLLYLPHATLEYRQHGDNQLGARRHTRLPNPLRTGPWHAWRDGLAVFERRISQAMALNALSKQHAFCNDEAQAAVTDFLDIFSARSRIGRLIRAFRSRLRCQRGTAHNALMYAQILFASV